MPKICISGRKCTLVTLYCSRSGSNSANEKELKKSNKKVKKMLYKGNKIKSKKNSQKVFVKIYKNSIKSTKYKVCNHSINGWI